METKTGIVKRTLRTRGYGFIVQSDGTDIFFHSTGVISPEFEQLKDGQVVEYYTVDSSKGDRAIGVVARKEVKQ